MKNAVLKNIYNVPARFHHHAYLTLVASLKTNNNPFPMKAYLQGKFDFNTLATANCLLPISVGKSYHEGEKFLATTHFINQNLKGCTVIMADTLQRFNNPDYFNQEDKISRELAQLQGNEWLLRNKTALDQLDNVTIKRWDDYLLHPTFQAKRQLIDDLYKNDKKFKQAVHKSVNVFLRRSRNIDIYRMNDEAIKNNLTVQKSLEYIKEECAVLLQFFDMEKTSAYMLYPNNTPGIFLNLSKHFKSSLKSLIIDFKEDKNLNISIDESKNIDDFYFQYFNGCLTTYNKIDSPTEANRFLLKTFIGLNTLLEHIKINEENNIGNLNNDSEPEPEQPSINRRNQTVNR